MPDVFLSYKREDLKAATRLVQALRAEGIEVWWDRDIPAGAPWEATIERALADAKVVLVCWSRAAVASDNVRSEARWAREQGRLIQLFVEPCNPPLFFGEHQGIDLADWPGDRTDNRFAALVRILRDRISGEAGAQGDHNPPPPRAPVARWRRVPRKGLVTAAVLAILALAGLGAWLARGEAPWGRTAEVRIAIMPFAALTGGDDAKALAARFTDDLSSILSANGRPIVSGPDAQSLSGPGGADRIRKLGVRLLFDGSAERDGDRLMLRVRLEDPQRGLTLWTSQKDAPAAQAEALEAQLGALTITVLNCASRALSPTNGLSDPEAMNLLLKVCDIYEDQVGVGDDPQAIFGLLGASRQLAAKAPGFAAGRSLLAMLDAQYRSYLPAAMNDQLVAEARSEAAKAQHIDPADIDAKVALYLLLPDADFTGRDKAIMGVRFDPSWNSGEIAKGIFLMDVGRARESVSAAQQVIASNPQGFDTDLVQPLLMAGQKEQAKAELDRLMRLWPGRFLFVDRELLYESEGDWDALDALLNDPSARLQSISDADVSRLKLIYAAARSHAPAELARARTAILNAAPGASASLANQVTHLAWLGFVNDAFALAGQISPAELNAADPPEALYMPQTASMRRDPRFMALAAHFGLVDYWRSTGVWPDFCSQPGLPYACKAEAAKLVASRSGKS